MTSEPGLPREGQHVRLRRLADTDLPRFQAYRGDAEVGQWQGWQPMAQPQAIDFLCRMATQPLAAPGQWLQLAVAERSSNGLVGDIGLRMANKQDPGPAVMEIGFTLARVAQGRGWAAEAVGLAIELVFDQTPAAHVLAMTDTRNAASVRLLERLGFVLTSTQHAQFRGQPCREHHYMRARPLPPQ